MHGVHFYIVFHFMMTYTDRCNCVFVRMHQRFCNNFYLTYINGIGLYFYICQSQRINSVLGLMQSHFNVIRKNDTVNAR